MSPVLCTASFAPVLERIRRRLRMRAVLAMALHPALTPPRRARVAGVLGIAAGLLIAITIAFLMRHESGYRRVVTPAVSLASLILAAAWFIDRVFALDLLSLYSLSAAAMASRPTLS